MDGADLAVDDAASVMRQIMAAEATPAQFGSFVTALRMKGETPEEVAGMATAMREVSLHVDPGTDVVDTCGTGGGREGLVQRLDGGVVRSCGRRRFRWPSTAIEPCQARRAAPTCSTSWV